jgi:glycosyltransferase involved in cell wall biosynthesis
VTKSSDPKLRVILSTNAPWASSGYSTQARDLLKRFKDHIDIACSCFYGLEGNSIEWNGIKCYPKMAQTYGSDALFHHQNDYKADVAMTFQDVWPMELGFLQKVRNWVAYVPVDYDPCPVHISDRLKIAYRVVAISRFGQRALEHRGIKAKLILEATDTQIFQPRDKIKARENFGVPKDLFLFGMVAVNKDNPPRKSFQHVLECFADFVKTHPNSGLYLQTLLQQEGGIDIMQLADYLGISKHIYYPPPYQYLFKSGSEVVSDIYNMFDCTLLPSNSEGFGLPIIESQACGVPVIVNDTCSMPELIIDNKTGYLCKGGDKRWSPIGAYMVSPDRTSLREKMELAFKNGRVKLQKACRKHILDQYDLDKRVKEEWLPFWEEIKNDIRRPRPQVIQSYIKNVG